MRSESPSGWKRASLGEVIELKRGYDLPTRKRVAGSVPIISSSGSSGWHNERKVNGPGVVTGRYGTIGEVYFVETDFWPLNTALYVRDFKGADPRFVSYFLKTIRWTKFTDKAAVPGVNRNHLHMEPVAVPPLDEQRRIAAVLGALDDKIELNRKMNQTLEAMAQAIFKSWFPDGDALEVELPLGWVRTTLGEWCDELGGEVQTGPFGSQLHASDYVPDGIPSVMPKNLKEDRVSVQDIARIKVQDAERLSKHRVAEGDIICSRRGDVERRALVTEREVGWLCGTGCLRVRLGGQRLDDHYLYRFLGLPEAGAWIVRHAQGATMPNLNTKILRAIPVLRPADAQRWSLVPSITKLFERRELNHAASATLAALRDTLLPKLISGEIRVPEAEAAVEAIT